MMGSMRSSSRLLDLLRIDVPVLRAPMAGTSTPEMAAAVSNAGGLGAIGVGATIRTRPVGRAPLRSVTPASAS